MTKLTGQCLCGAIKYQADGEIKMQANCHCTDCRQSSGSTFGTLLFMAEEDVKITGQVKSFAHSVDSGNKLIKEFCPNCGSQLFGKNERRPGSLAIKVGTINEQHVVKPQFNVFAGSKMACTILDSEVPAFDKMPS